MKAQPITSQKASLDNPPADLIAILDASKQFYQSGWMKRLSFCWGVFLFSSVPGAAALTLGASESLVLPSILLAVAVSVAFLPSNLATIRSKLGYNKTTSASHELLRLAMLVSTKKVRNEVLGDEFEWISIRESEGMPPWLNQIHTMFSIFWALYYTATELLSPTSAIRFLYKKLIAGK